MNEKEKGQASYKTRISYPDINLLAPLAGILKIDVNTLLALTSYFLLLSSYLKKGF